jgi:hypothetical protein
LLAPHRSAGYWRAHKKSAGGTTSGGSLLSRPVYAFDIAALTASAVIGSERTRVPENIIPRFCVVRCGSNLVLNLSMDLRPASNRGSYAYPDDGQFPSADGSRYNKAGRNASESCIMKIRVVLVLVLVLAGVVSAIPALAGAQNLSPPGGPSPPPFTATLSNNTPLAVGMDAEAAARALGGPLNYISGRPGDEIYLAYRDVGGSGLFSHKDRLYLQFRQGRLAGWKGDWGHNWMWQ